MEKFSVLYIDEHIAVVYKPSGLLSVPISSYKGGRTALSELENYMRKTGRYSSNHRPAAVHRLDRDTSGILLFALTRPIQKKIMDNWNSVVTKRLYRAVCENPLPKNDLLKGAEKGTINKPLSYNAYNIAYVQKENQLLKQENKTKNQNKKSISAITHYKILKKGKDFSLFELNLETGRKNQIRAHLSYAGYTICGDENYRSKKNPFGRLALHAAILEFIHPVSGKEMSFKVDEPEQWKNTI